MSTFGLSADMELFCPPRASPVRVTSAAEAWQLCAALRAPEDALAVVLVGADECVLAVGAAGHPFLDAVYADVEPLARLVELFEARQVYVAARGGDLPWLIEAMEAALWPDSVWVEALPAWADFDAA